MGFGGSNTHVTLEEANPGDIPSEEELSLLASSQNSELILLSGDSPSELRHWVDRLRSLADRICQAELTDLAAELAKGPHQGCHRLAIVAQSPWQLAAVLSRLSEQLATDAFTAELDDPSNGIYAGVTVEAPSFVALFPGQGSQRLNMADQLVGRYPFIRALYEDAERAIAAILPQGLTSRILHDLDLADEQTVQTWEAELRSTRVAQPGIVLSSLAILRVLNFFGLTPSRVIGHSLGEITALRAAGAYDDVTAVRIAALRGKAMAELELADPGTMLAIGAEPDVVEKLIFPFKPAVTIANYNSPRQTIVAGTSAAIEALGSSCADRGIYCRSLPVSHAFHSEIVAPAAPVFEAAITPIAFERLSLPVISTATGQELQEGTNIRSLLGEHIRQPVRFMDAVLCAAEHRPDLWIEVGPNRILGTLVRDILSDQRPECLATDAADQDGFDLLNNLLARAYVLGFPLITSRLFAYRFSRPFSLETYEPLFITNPCERLVEAPPGLPAQEANLVPGLLLPAATDPGDFAEYLAKRQVFLKEFIALDFKHYLDSNPTKASLQPPVIPDQTDIAETKTEADQEETLATEEDVLDFVSKWIAQRTGFPIEMITPEKKLRDDLNLDSIKVSELVLVLMRKLECEVYIDHRRLVNACIGELVTVLYEERKKDRLPQLMIVKTQNASAAESKAANWVRTFEMGRVHAPLDAEQSTSLLKQGVSLIIGERGCPRAQAILEHLHQMGCTTLQVEMASFDAGTQVLEDVAALIVVLPVTTTSFVECTSQQFESRLALLPVFLFRLFRWAGYGNESVGRKLPVLIFRAKDEEDDRGADLDAGAALLKSLRLENPGAILKWVTLPAAWTPAQWAEIVMQELEREGSRVAYEYDVTGVRTAEVAFTFGQAAANDLSLTSRDVILVTGGAKGVTFELAFGLAQERGVSLALLGSSPMPALADSDEQNEILFNLRRLEQEEIHALYLQCDVTDLEALRKVVTEVESSLGPITGILHGAGLSQPHFFSDMSLDTALHCIRVKVQGLWNLLTTVPLNQLKTLQVISSVLGKTGMQGQSDYTLANAWLDGIVKQVKKKYPLLQCLSLGYSIWSNKGMGVKLGIIDFLRAAGVTPIPLTEGVDAYLELVRQTPSGAVFVVTGRLPLELEAQLYPSVSEIHGRFLSSIVRWIPGTELLAEASLSHETDLYLAEHVFEGTPLFPGVMGIEVLVEGAMACANTNILPIVRNVEFRRALIIPEGTSVLVRIHALAEPEYGEPLRVWVTLKSNSDGFRESHIEAECLFDAVNADSLQPLSEDMLFPEPLPIEPEQLSPFPLFQGKFFRRIVKILKLEPGKESITEIQVPDEESYYSESLQPLTFTPSPAVRDSFLQSAGLIMPYGYPLKPGQLVISMG
jgi:enediyne polyketide synthase